MTQRKAPMRRRFNPAIWLAALMMLVWSLDAAQAATFKPGRGISLDIWVTWPDESRWQDPSVLLPFPEWRRHLNDGDLEALRSAGFDTVRLPVDPSVFLSPRTEALRDDLHRSVAESVRAIREAGLKVIVDLHSIPAGPNRAIGTGQILGDETMFEAYLDLARTMAATVARFDAAGVALELMNEPTADCEGRAAPDWQARAKRLWAAARAAALDTTLILSGACWGGAEGLAALDPKQFADDNIVWSFHSYAPFILTHQGAGWTGDVSPHATGLPYPPYGPNAARTEQAMADIRARVRAEVPFLRRPGMIAFVEGELAEIDTAEKLRAVMAEPFETAARWADENGIDRADIFLGEFGMIRQEYGQDFIMEPAWRAAYYRDMIALAESHGFGWSLWGYGGAFGVVETFEGKRAEPHVLDVVRALP